jgi:zinc transport system permease protein
MIFEALEMQFFQRALYAGLLVSVMCGIIGTYVVVKEMGSISGGLSHAALGGVGIGYFFGFDPMLGAAVFSVFCAVLLGLLYRKQYQGIDTLITVLWSSGMALGLILISLSPGYAPELHGYLFGSILLVPANYLWSVLVVDLALILIVVKLFNELRAVTFDEEFSEIIGIRVTGLTILLFILIAISVVLLMKVTGVILTIALLTLPAVVARQWLDSLYGIMISAMIITAVFCCVGLFSSYALAESYSLDFPSGALIVMMLTILYGLSSVFHVMRNKF